MKLSETEMTQVCKAIDGAVGSMGYPVVGKALAILGVDRTNIRLMERKGLIKSVDLNLHGQLVKGYYTDKVYPEKLRKPIPTKEPIKHVEPSK
jgi:hypothetical protein